MRCPITESECSRQFCLDNPKLPECPTAATDLSKLMVSLLIDVQDGKITEEEGRAKFNEELSARASMLGLPEKDLREETRFIFVETDFNAPAEQNWFVLTCFPLLTKANK